MIQGYKYVWNVMSHFSIFINCERKEMFPFYYNLRENILSFVKLQIEQPKRGNCVWVSTWLTNIKELYINESLEENRQMTKKQFKKDLKIRDTWSCIKLSVRKTKNIKYSNGWIFADNWT